MSGHSNNPFLSTSEKVGNSIINGYGLYNVVGGGFPGIIPYKDGVVHGEVWKIPNSDVEDRLDWLEGVSGDRGMYRKEFVDTEYGEALVYVWNSPTPEYNYIEGGSWDRFTMGK